MGIVIKNRFLNFISKLQAQHYSSDLLDLCFLWTVTGKVTVTGAVVLFYFFLRYVSFSAVLLDGNTYYLVFC